MGKIIAVANQKGGVGKTTTSVNLTSALGELGKKCLLVDIDPQGNATSGMGIEKKRGKEASSYELILGEVAANSLIIETEFKNVWIIPASMELAGAELELVNVEYRERRLKMALAAAREKFDFILICPPSLGLITINALTAADSVIVPIQCEYYALEGLSQLTNTVSKVKRLYNEQLETEGVLMTMYDSRLNLTQEVAAQVKKFFPRQVFKTVIPRAVRLSEAPSFGQPINYFDKRSKGADAYRSLAKEIIKKNRK